MQTQQTHIYTVTELTLRIKELLEDSFPILWISGEISNLSRPASGHFYFTLKDENAQIRAVLFKGQARHLSFRLEDGLTIVGLGRIGVYAPQGQYQLILEMIEPKGRGALQLAFEQLKAKLAQEGLFDPALKRPLPYLPRRVCIITSPTGAVIHDMMQIMGRRFPTVPIQIIPVRVQGQGAEAEIAAALELANLRDEADVVVIARGGGSLEDLQPFNTETLARAIHCSRIPVVSAVGHETDYTIADFVADKRAPTPSAAAELIVPERELLKAVLFDLERRAQTGIERTIAHWMQRLKSLDERLASPRKRFLTDRLLAIDDLYARSVRAIDRMVAFSRERMMHYERTLSAYHPSRWIAIHRVKLNRFDREIQLHLTKIIDEKCSLFRRLEAMLFALSPLGILERGYSITQAIPGQHIVTSSDTIDPDDRVSIRLFRGRLICRVERTLHGQDDI